MKYARIAILCFVLLLMVAATPAQEEPVTISIGTTYIFDTLNPTQGFYGYGRRPLWHDTLVEYGGRDIFAPGIAESW